MKITKQAGTFNMYRLEASFGELDAIRQALEKDHSGAVGDELYHTIDWYWKDNHMPFPGQEEEDIKKDKEKAKNAAEGTDEEGGGELGLEAPPEDGAGDEGLEGAEGEGDSLLDLGDGVHPDEGGEGASFSPAEEEGNDLGLPAPPARF